MPLVQDIVNKVKSQLSTQTTPSGFVPSAPEGQGSPSTSTDIKNGLVGDIASGIGTATNGIKGETPQPSLQTSPGISRFVPQTQSTTHDVEPAVPSYGAPSLTEVSSMAPVGTAGSFGTNGRAATSSIDDLAVDALKSIGIEPGYQADLSEWERQRASDENREVRTQSLYGEDYDYDGGGLGWLDKQIDYLGNTPTNDTYLRDLYDRGLISQDDAFALMHRGQSLDMDRMMRDEMDVSPTLFESDGERIDDGTPNYFNLTSDLMSGTQYKYYRDTLGMGGREGYIDPTQVYSKRREYNNYGFIPFTPDMATLSTMVTQNVLDVPSGIGRNIANARQAITPDYKISYDENGNRRTISGDDFDRNAQAFMNSYYHDSMYNPEKFLTRPTDTDAYTTLVNQFEVPDANGNATYHYGHLVDVSPTYDGSIQFSFSDGSSVKTNQDFLESVMDDGGNISMMPSIVPLQSVRGIVDVDSMAPGLHQSMVNETAVPDADGNMTYHYGNLVSVGDGPDGTYSFSFEDGSTVNAPASFFDQVYDKETNNVTVPYQRVFVEDASGDPGIKPAVDETNYADVRYMPDMVLSDGTRMRLQDVERILNDQTPGDDEERKDPDTGRNIMPDDDISYEFSGIGGLPISGNPLLDALNDAGLLITNRPARLGGQEIFSIGDDGKIQVDTSNIMNDTLDWTLGSVPISVPGMLPWIYSASGASRGIEGVNPMSYNPSTDSYGLVAGRWDDDGNLRYGVYDQEGQRDSERSRSTRLWNAAGNFAVPLTEQLVGPVGEHLIPLEGIASRIPARSALGRLAIDELVGAAGEGVEEILGNPFEELTSYGLDAYADPVIDEETGKPVTDMYGHELRQEGTSALGRANNFAVNGLMDNINAFAGGALVDAMMRSVPIPLTGTKPLARDVYDAVMRDRARLSTGVPLYVSPDEIGRDLDEDYAGLFDDDGLVRR